MLPGAFSFLFYICFMAGEQAIFIHNSSVSRVGTYHSFTYIYSSYPVIVHFISSARWLLSFIYIYYSRMYTTIRLWSTPEQLIVVLVSGESSSSSSMTSQIDYIQEIIHRVCLLIFVSCNVINHPSIYLSIWQLCMLMGQSECSI